MEFFTYTIVILVVMLLCALAMAVGLILRNKTFTSCGCASIRFRGEKISCASCPDRDESCESKHSAESAPKVQHTS